MEIDIQSDDTYDAKEYRGMAILGGILIHPIAFGLAYLGGAVFGHPHLTHNGYQGAPREYGSEGASNAAFHLLLFYLEGLIGFGIGPFVSLLILSAFGAGMAVITFPILATSIRASNRYLSNRIRNNKLPISRGSEQGLWTVVVACFLFVIGSQLISSSLISSTMGWEGIVAGILLFLVGASCLVIAWRTK